MIRQAATWTVAVVLLGGCAGLPSDTAATLHMSAGERQSEARQLVVTFVDHGAAGRVAAGGSPRPYASAGRYDGSARSRWLAASVADDYGLSRVAGWRISSLDLHCVVYEAGTRDARDAALDRLRRDPRVESVQPMLTFGTRSGQQAYDDPLFSLQTAVATLEVPAAHAWSTGRNVQVAVIDTGVDVEHPDLTGRVAGTWNLVDEDDEAFRRDRHGTAVAGVVAAAERNGLGIVGVAPDVDILAMKACWEVGAGAPDRCNTLTLAAALDIAIDQRAQVINLSLAGPPDPLLARLVHAALEAGVVVVGPHAPDAEGVPGFPGVVEGVLTVIDADDPGSGGGELAAPGRHVLTLVPGARFDYVSGVSYSTAMVSGVVALLVELGPMSPQQVTELLRETADSPGADGVRLVNACRALSRLNGGLGCGGQK